MARPSTLRPVFNAFTAPLDPETEVTTFVPFFADPQGMNLAIPLPKLDTNTSPYLENLRVDERGILCCRAGTIALGTVASEPQLGGIIYRDSLGGEFILRFTINQIQKWSGSSWITLSGPSLGLAQNEFVQTTVWNTFLMMISSSGLFEINLTSNTYRLISAAPRGKHITTFAGRLVISNIIGSPNLPTRLQWCVKNNSEDWTGLGSGFEDLLSAPGGEVDIQHGVFPINDQEALIIRSSSVWIAQLTGQFDSPFNFLHLYSGVQCDSPYSIASIPGGAILLSRDNITAISSSGPTQLGDAVRSTVFVPNSNLRDAVGTYDSFLREYRLLIPQRSFSNRQVVYRYSMEGKKWFQDSYPYQIKRIIAVNYEAHTQIGQLTGTIASLTGPINQLGLSGLSHSGLIIQKGSKYIMREDYMTTTEADGSGGTVNIPIDLQTGLVTRSNVMDYTNMTEQQLEIIAAAAMTLTLQYKDETGVWQNYSTIQTSISTMPALYRALKYLRRRVLQLRLTCTNGGPLQILAWFVGMTKGGRVNQ